MSDSMKEMATGDFVEGLLEFKTTGIARDLKLNLRRLMEEGSLDKEESTLALLAVATAVDHRPFVGHARERLAALGVASEQIQEAAEVAAIMGMLNLYYRFRHMVQKDDDYKTANLRMTSMAKPAMGKEKYEMLAMAVSVVNGCSNCIQAHEDTLRKAGVSVEKIHDLARLASVINGLKTLERASSSDAGG
jgi:alkyl hydroperoxide reductase subunit D